MNDDNVIRVPRVVQTGAGSAVSIWPPDETGIATTTLHSLAQPIRPTPSPAFDLAGQGSATDGAA
jgi:hypothetical protein